MYATANRIAKESINLTSEQIDSLIPLAREGNRVAIDQLAKSQLKLCIKIASGFFGDTEEYLSIALGAIMDAIRTYRVADGATFASVVRAQGEAQIKRAIQYKNLVRLPSNLFMVATKAKKILDNAMTGGKELEHSKDVQFIMSYLGSNTTSMNRPLGDESETLENFFEGPKHEFVESLEIQQIEQIAHEVLGSNADIFLRIAKGQETFRSIGLEIEKSHERVRQMYNVWKEKVQKAIELCEV